MILSVPFSASSKLWDQFELDGALQADADALALEFEGKWEEYDDLGRLKGTTEWPPTRIAIPYAQLSAIRLRFRWLRGPLIEFETHAVAAMQGFPLAKGVQAEVPIARRHRDEAQLLVSEISAAISEAMIRRLEAGS